MSRILDRAMNEPILVPAVLVSLLGVAYDVVTDLDGETTTLWAVAPILIAAISRRFTTGPMTAARDALDAMYSVAEPEGPDVMEDCEHL